MIRKHGLLAAWLACGLLAPAAGIAPAARAIPLERPHTVSASLEAALRGTQAWAVVLEAKTGVLLAQRDAPHPGHEASTRLAEPRETPGSAIKPLLLAYALAHGIVRADTEVYCRRDLRIAGVAYPCTHPAGQPVFTAESALAESCNSWFAVLGLRFTGPQLEAALTGARVPHADLGHADAASRQLAVLGLRGEAVSPLELAKAYVTLIEDLPGESPVRAGMLDSVNFGMAHPAAVAGVPILGKTGTASNAGEAWTHGWFVGVLPARLIVVILVPHGDGGTAAALGRQFFVQLTEHGL